MIGIDTKWVPCGPRMFHTTSMTPHDHQKQVIFKMWERGELKYSDCLLLLKELGLEGPPVQQATV